MAVRAGRAQLAFMGVLMAGYTIFLQSQERLPQVFHADRSPLTIGHPLGLVTLVTSHPRMFSRERITGLGMIESLLGWLPVDQRKLSAVVFGMAARAILRHPGFVHDGVVESPRLRQSSCDFLMAVKALERAALGPELVARRALCRAIHGLMCSGKGAGRDLRVRRNSGTGQQKSNVQQTDASFLAL